MTATSTAVAAPAPSSAEEFVEVIRSLLANGKAGVARRTAAEGAARFPDHAELRKTDEVINPTRVVSRPADAPDRTQEFAWLRENGARYRGCWVALLADELLAYGQELEAVLQEVHTRGLESKALVHRIG
jgi:hypothetical protein